MIQIIFRGEKYSLPHSHSKTSASGYAYLADAEICSSIIFRIQDIGALIICSKEEKELQDLSFLVVNNRYNRNRIISPSLFVCWD